jgi:2-methylcitrate dehydratase PrpD
MGLTDRLTSFVLDTTIDSMPERVVQSSRDMILNGLAVAIAARTTPEAHALYRFAEAMGGEATCTIVGAPFTSSPMNAALVNGVLVHVLDFDEVVLRRANHPTNVLLPTVMAMGEFVGASGRAVLEAFAIGCEVSTKLGAIGDLDEIETTLDHNGWHVEGVAGAIGAAAAAGKLLGLDATKLGHALGMAVSEASGVQANFGTSTKSLHCGLAAMHGVLAGILARDGLTANPNAIEAKGGFLTAYRHNTAVDVDEFIGRLGNPFDVIDPGLGLKFYPCGSALHTAIDLTVELTRANNLVPSDVESIHVSWPGLPKDKLAGFSTPSTGLEAKFSLPYVVAVAVAFGAPTLEHFTDAAVTDPIVRGLMPLVTNSTNEKATRDASRPATVTIRLTDGRELRAHADHAKGHPDNPMSPAELDSKFNSCSRDYYSSAERVFLIQSVRDLDQFDDCTDLFSLLRNKVNSATP